MTRQRAGLAVVVFFLARFAFAAPDLPDCALRCVTISATVQCDIDHFTCICHNYPNPVRQCIKTICSGAAGIEQSRQFEMQCDNVGAPIPGGATGSRPTTSAPTSSPQPTPTPTPTTQNPPDTTQPTSKPPANTPGPSTPLSSGSQSSSTSGLPASGGSNQSAPEVSQTNAPNSNIATTTGGSSMGSLIGAVVGGLVGGLLVVALVFFLLKRRKRRELDGDDGVASFSAHGDNMSYMSRSDQPMLMQDMSPIQNYSTLDSYRMTPTPPGGVGSPVGRPVGAAAYGRGTPSVADSQNTFAARPFTLDDPNQNYVPRKGDPSVYPTYRPTSSSYSDSVPAQSVRGPASAVSDSQAGSSSGQSGAPRQIVRDRSSMISTALSSGAQELSPEQLNIVQTMVNRGLPGPAVVDVIQAMLVENQAVPPEYVPPTPRTPSMGTLPPPSSGPPPPLPTIMASPAPSGSSSTALPYRQNATQQHQFS